MNTSNHSDNTTDEDAEFPIRQRRGRQAGARADTEESSRGGREGEDDEDEDDWNADNSGDEDEDDDDEEEDRSLKGRLLSVFDRFAAKVTRWTGSPLAFALAVGLVVVWAVSGPIFDYSETWQLVINTGTTIVTFLMVFLIQQSQNKDSQAVHVKLDELLKAQRHARNKMIDIEDLTEVQLTKLALQFKKKQTGK